MIDLSSKYSLGTIEASEQLINDLYIVLRENVNLWASITNQTAQARMGYVGQHLVSVVTGYKGGKTGARGYDLILPNGKYAEIKTCYRVDQLGLCNNCGAAVASIELTCSKCGSNDISRKDDSKWLISFQNSNEFTCFADPEYYYLVLFEFVDLNIPNEIQASIWKVLPENPGFLLCIIDYYYNIRANSVSTAPYNLWPYMLKFYLMKPLLIYRSVINIDNNIDTKIFPGRDDEIQELIPPLQELSRSTTLSKTAVIKVLDHLGLIKNDSMRELKKSELLQVLEDQRNNKFVTDAYLADLLSWAIYLPKIDSHYDSIPEKLKEKLTLSPPKKGN